jgi:Xaa-Pro dipeptidase
MRYQKRIDALIEHQKEEGLDAVVLIPGPSLFYFTGLSFHLMERPVITLLSVEGEHRMLLPGLEQAKTKTCPIDFKFFTYGEQEGAALEALTQAVVGSGLSNSQIGIEPLRMRSFEQSLLESTLDDVRFRSADRAISALRMHKEEAEIANMQQATEIAEDALTATLPLIKVGMTELELASELSLQLLRAGSEPEMPFSPIVASGPNSAMGHATPSERTLTTGDSLVLDWGAAHHGYMSDITRSFFVGDPPDQFIEIHEIVGRANAAGREAVRPGVTCGSVDQVTRNEIAEAGYAEYFHHRTGHGLGLEAHEPPFIREGEETLLETGMTFTIEPGVYLPGRGGVRVEDDMVVSEEGGVSLTTLAREARVVG